MPRILTKSHKYIQNYQQKRNQHLKLLNHFLFFWLTEIPGTQSRPRSATNSGTKNVILRLDTRLELARGMRIDTKALTLFAIAKSWLQEYRKSVNLPSSRPCSAWTGSFCTGSASTETAPLGTAPKPTVLFLSLSFSLADLKQKVSFLISYIDKHRHIKCTTALSINQIKCSLSEIINESFVAYAIARTI